jgi:hypothetical protein
MSCMSSAILILGILRVAFELYGFFGVLKLVEIDRNGH